MMFAGSAFRSIKTDGDQLARLIINQRKIHAGSEFVGISGDAVQRSCRLRRVLAACRQSFVDAHGAKRTVNFSSSQRRRFSSAIQNCRSSDDWFEARTDSISEATDCSSEGRAASHSSGDLPIFVTLSSIARKALRTSLVPTI